MTFVLLLSSVDIAADALNDVVAEAVAYESEAVCQFSGKSHFTFNTYK